MDFKGFMLDLIRLNIYNNMTRSNFISFFFLKAPFALKIVNHGDQSFKCYFVHNKFGKKI